MNSLLLDAIARFEDRSWLEQCRAHNLAKGNTDVADAVRKRVQQLEMRSALQIRTGGHSVEERVAEGLRIYETFLRAKHGRRQAAGYTRRDIKKLGANGALIKTIRGSSKTEGLRLLAEHGRLDCSYEQIAIDFEGDFPPDVVAKARSNLVGLQIESLKRTGIGGSKAGQAEASKVLMEPPV